MIIKRTIHTILTHDIDQMIAEIHETTTAVVVSFTITGNTVEFKLQEPEPISADDDQDDNIWLPCGCHYTCCTCTGSEDRPERHYGDDQS